MASDQAPDLSGLFATAAQTKPSRTYSHRGKNSRARSLPALKPTSEPANAGVRLQRCRIGKANSWELKPVNERSALIIQTDHGEQTTAVGDRLPPQVTDEPDNPHRGRAQETSSSSTAKCAEEITSPVPPPSSSHESLGFEEKENAEVEDKDDDEDDLIVLSQRPLGYNPKHDRRTANGTRSLRRRPFLIFDKTESKGYKQLKSKSQPEKTATASRHHPGDGFSGREARPNGSNLLTRAGKQSITTFHVGVLDLTQSEPPPVKRKRRVRNANLDDNSFVSAPKKTRRPLAPKDPNQQLKSAMVSPDQAKKGTSVIHRTCKIETHPTAQGAAVIHAKETQVRDAVTKPSPPHPNTTHQSTSADDDDEVDMIVIERSDDVDGTRDAILPHHGRPTKEGQDGFGSHVSVTPPQQRRIRAQSVSPESPARRAAGSKEEVPSGRVFRRVNTQ